MPILCGQNDGAVKSHLPAIPAKAGIHNLLKTRDGQPLIWTSCKTIKNTDSDTNRLYADPPPWADLPAARFGQVGGLPRQTDLPTLWSVFLKKLALPIPS